MGLLFGAFARHASTRPHCVAMRVADDAIDYAALLRRIGAARAVLESHGVGRGDRVAFLGCNAPEIVELLVACAEIGALLVPLNFRLAVAEHQHIVEHAGVGTMIVDGDFAAHAARLTGVRPLPLDEFRGQLLARARAADSRERAPERPDGGDDAPCLLVYTSGTSGAPKGALHTQASLWANARASWAAHDMVDTDHVLTVLPMFHVGGLCIQTLPALLCGASVTLHARADAGAWLRDVARLRPSLSLLVPPIMKAVIEHADFASTDLGSLRLLMAGSSVVPLSLIEGFHARGIPVGQVYGATETGPVSIVLRREDAYRKAGGAGWPALGVQVRLCDETGAQVPPGEVGEVRLHAPNLARGYWRDPGNLAFADGWFNTSDLARCDADGCYFVVGRSKDMIVSGGENVYPAEIENLLAEYPGVAESAVVGLPHPHWGEVPVAAVVLTEPGAIAGPDELIAFLAERLARYKLPRRVEFLDQLPKSALGKVQKGLLRDRLR